MITIAEFIADARQKGLSDDTIRQALEEQGWNKSTVSLALAGLTAPKPDVTAMPTEPVLVLANRPYHPLLAALHHVLLWFFVIASTIAISAVVSSLLGESVDSNSLAAMIVVVVITFTPYAVLYILFLRKMRSEPKLVPGRVWSIITICIHSLAALIAAIVLAVTVIVDGNSSTIISSALILALVVIVLVTYVFAAFVQNSRKIRNAILISYLPILALLIGTLLVMSALRLGPALTDQHLRENIVTTIENIRSNVEADNQLPPTSEVQSLIKGAGIAYTIKSSSTYTLCATFATDTRQYPSNASDQSKKPTVAMSDNYIYPEAFYQTRGDHCFLIEASGIPTSQGIIFSPAELLND